MDDQAGIEFKADVFLLKRQNIGWCTTEPITYANYDGIWEKTSDSTLRITYEYWDGYAQ